MADPTRVMLYFVYVIRGVMSVTKSTGFSTYLVWCDNYLAQWFASPIDEDWVEVL